MAEFWAATVGLTDKSVAEIGVGEGRFLSMVKNRYGAVVFGIEPSTSNRELLKAAGRCGGRGTTTLDIHSFFERWHVDTAVYSPDSAREPARLGPA